MQVHYLAREQMRAAIEDAWAVEENQSPNAGKIYSDHEAMQGRFPDSRLPLIQFLKDLFVPVMLAVGSESSVHLQHFFSHLGVSIGVPHPQMDDRGTPSYGNQMIPGRTSSQDTGATFWNELEEETELYDGREGDLLAVPWCEALKVNTCGVNMKILGFIYH
jgi:hypothetical protein